MSKFRYLIRRLPLLPSVLVFGYIIVSWLIIRKGQGVYLGTVNSSKALLSVVPVLGNYQIFLFVNTLFFALLMALVSKSEVK